MTTINRAVIRIEIEDYISAIQNNYGYIDGADYLTITENEAVLEYEYISGAENVYFNKVNFMGNVYPVSEDLKSASCYKAIKEYLKLHKGVEANED